MKVRWTSKVLIVSLMLGALIVPAGAQSQSLGFTAPVAGGVPNLVGGAGAFKGTLRITGFDKQHKELVANAIIDGDVSDAGHTVIGNIRRFGASAPAPTLRASCERLDMELNNVKVQTQGFDVKLDPVIIAISIKDYPNDSKKLGKLLCNLAKQLEKGKPGGAMADELNHILRVIGG